MFTGIVEETGEITETTSDEAGRRLRVASTFEDLSVGQSVSVSGACLTVEAYGDGWFEVFLAEETLARTYLGELGAGEAVNLERALPADGRFDGHFVQGHVDATAEIRSIENLGEDWRYAFSLPPEIERYVVEKGSIAVDGVSLTVADLSDGAFEVAIVPETHAVTNFSAKTTGDPVHLEVDVVAKYVERLLEGYPV